MYSKFHINFLLLKTSVIILNVLGAKKTVFDHSVLQILLEQHKQPKLSVLHPPHSLEVNM